MARLKNVFGKVRFENECRRVADKVGVEVSFYNDDHYQRAFEDDGTLHICSKSGLRACFHVGNDDGEEQNKKTRAVMEAMRLAATERVLVGEDS